MASTLVTRITQHTESKSKMSICRNRSKISLSWCRRLFLACRYWILLYVITFLIILPVFGMLCRNTLYDHILPRNKTREKIRLQEENTIRYNKSIALLQKIESRRLLNHFKAGFQGADTSSIPMDSGKPTVVVTLITVSRNDHRIEDYEPRYLTQTTVSFLQLMEQQSALSVQIAICNVDSKPDAYTELKSLPSWIPVFQKFTSSRVNYVNGIDDHLEKEKQDYVYCLERSLSLNTSFVLLVEDDALPRSDLFPVLELLLAHDLKSAHAYNHKRVSYVKLYHPDRLLGYISLEVERLPELFSLSLLLCTVIILIYGRWTNKNAYTSIQLWMMCFVYVTLVLLLVGRQNVMEFRRLSRHLYQVTPAPSCCTPAMLFSQDGGREIANYLTSVHCKSSFAKDTAIDKLRVERKLVAKFVQPNLFTHIGQYSSLRPELVDPFIV